MKRILGYLPIAAALCVGLIPGSSFGQDPQTMPGTTDTSSPTQPTGPVTQPTRPLVVQSTTGTVGSYLTDAQGMSLYMFEADPSSVSTCYGTCAQAWPPVLVKDQQSIQGAGDIMSSMLGTTQRADGTTQLTYNGMPLYYYVTDQKPGDITGQGVYDHGALWYLVRPDGAKLVSSQ